MAELPIGSGSGGRKRRAAAAAAGGIAPGGLWAGVTGSVGCVRAIKATVAVHKKWPKWPCRGPAAGRPGGAIAAPGTGMARRGLPGGGTSRVRREKPRVWAPSRSTCRCY